MFQVLWEKAALNELTALWLRADSVTRKSITAAVAVIDDRLKLDADTEGESRDGTQRLSFVPPLAVLFQVSEPDRSVTVLQVGWSRRKK